jgi:hypothetical protein
MNRQTVTECPAFGRRAGVCALALALLLAAGCGREAVNFNNTIANGNKKLNEAGKKFGAAVDPALKGETADVEKVKAAHKAAVEALEQVKKDTSNAKVPGDPTAKKLAEGYQEFLKVEEDVIKNKFGAVATALETKTPPKSSEGTFAEQLKTILREASKEEGEALKTLHDLQKDFAKAHDLPLKTPAQ